MKNYLHLQHMQIVFHSFHACFPPINCSKQCILKNKLWYFLYLIKKHSFQIMFILLLSGGKQTHFLTKIIQLYQIFNYSNILIADSVNADPVKGQNGSRGQHSYAALIFLMVMMMRMMMMNMMMLMTWGWWWWSRG